MNQGLALFTTVVAIGHIIPEYKAFWEIAVEFKKPIKTDKIIKTTKTMKFMKKILRGLHELHGKLEIPFGTTSPKIRLFAIYNG